LLLQRLGQDPARGHRVLRPPLQHRLFRTGSAGPGAPDGGPVNLLRCTPLLLAALLAALPSTVAAAPAEGDELRFVTCPIYRNTDAGRKSGCWLADSPDEGQ